MKRAIALTLALTFALPSAALAESVCAAAYREANSKFFENTANLQTYETIGGVAKWGGVPGGIACMILARRSKLLMAGCAILGLAITGGGYVGENMAEAAIDRERSVHQAEDPFLIYQIYYAYRKGEANQSVDVQILVNNIGVQGLDGETAAKEVADMMDSGELCANGDAPAVSYWDMADIIKDRLASQAAR
jgi:hypothetical protein